MKQPIGGRWDTVRNKQMVRTTALCAPDWDVCSQVCKGAGSLCMGTGEQAWSENCCWLWGYRLRGQEGKMHSKECLWRKTGLPWKQGTTAESYIGGGATIVASLSPHNGSCRRTIKEASGFPGGTVVESLPAGAGDTSSSPGLGRSHMLRSN